MPLAMSTSFGAIGEPVGLPEWDSAKTATEIVLSNGNLTATKNAPSVWKSTLAGLGHTSGKKYWEYTIDVHPTSQHQMIGAQGDSVSLDFETFVGATGSSFGWQSNKSAGQGDLRRNGTQIDLLFGEYDTGDIVMVAFDIDNGNAWLGKNGTWVQGDPGTATSPPVTGLSAGKWYAGWSGFSATNEATVNFGATAFTYTIPTGYTAYNA